MPLWRHRSKDYYSIKRTQTHMMIEMLYAIDKTYIQKCIKLSLANNENYIHVNTIIARHKSL